MNERGSVESFEKDLIGGEVGKQGNRRNCREGLMGLNSMDDVGPGRGGVMAVGGGGEERLKSFFEEEGSPVKGFGGGGGLKAVIEPF